MNTDPTSVYKSVFFALDASMKRAMYGTSAVARATASVLAVLWCDTLWANSYACMLGMNSIIVSVFCLLIITMMAIRKGSLGGVESTGLLTCMMPWERAIVNKFFVSRSCTERQTVGNGVTSPFSS